MPRPRRYVLDEAQIRRMSVDEGMPDRIIAAVYGCDRSMITAFRKTHGIARQPIPVSEERVNRAIRAWRNSRAQPTAGADPGAVTIAETAEQSRAFSRLMAGAKQH